MFFAVFIIADTDKKYLFKALQPFRIVPAPDLPDSCLGGLIPFQFYHHRQIDCRINIMFRNKHNIRKALSGRHLLNDLILFFGIIIGNQDNESQRLFIVVIDNRRIAVVYLFDSLCHDIRFALQSVSHAIVSFHNPVAFMLTTNSSAISLFGI